MADKIKPTIPADHVITYKELESALGVTKGYILTEMAKMYLSKSEVRDAIETLRMHVKVKYISDSEFSVRNKYIYHQLKSLSKKQIVTQRVSGMLIGFSLALFIFFAINAWHISQIFSFLGDRR